MGYFVHWCCYYLGFFSPLYVYICSTFLLPLVAELLCFYVFFGSYSSAGGCWKPVFCFPEGGTMLNFVIAPLPTDRGLFSEFTPCLLELQSRGRCGLALRALRVPANPVGKSSGEIFTEACGKTFCWSSGCSEQEPQPFNAL